MKATYFIAKVSAIVADLDLIAQTVTRFIDSLSEHTQSQASIGERLLPVKAGIDQTHMAARELYAQIIAKAPRKTKAKPKIKAKAKVKKASRKK